MGILQTCLSFVGLDCLCFHRLSAIHEISCNLKMHVCIYMHCVYVHVLSINFHTMGQTTKFILLEASPWNLSILQYTVPAGHGGVPKNYHTSTMWLIATYPLCIIPTRIRFYSSDGSMAVSIIHSCCNPHLNVCTLFLDLEIKFALFILTNLF